MRTRMREVEREMKGVIITKARLKTLSLAFQGDIQVRERNLKARLKTASGSAANWDGMSR